MQMRPFRPFRERFFPDVAKNLTRVIMSRFSDDTRSSMSLLIGSSDDAAAGKRGQYLS
jgi:hypothetical protein